MAPPAHPAVRRIGACLVTALIFDCDGVLADTERYGHLPAFNATFEAVRLAGALERGRLRREAADRRRQGAHGEPVRRPRVRPGRRGARRRGGARRAARRRGTARKTAAFTRWSRRGPDPARPGDRAHHPRRARRRLDRRGRLDVRRGVGAGGARARRRGRGGGPRPGVRRRRRAGEEAGPGDLPARAGASWGSTAPRPSSWRTRATGCSPRPGPGCPAW